MRRCGPSLIGLVIGQGPAARTIIDRLFAMETLSVTGNPSPGGSGGSPAGSADRSPGSQAVAGAAEGRSPGSALREEASDWGLWQQMSGQRCAIKAGKDADQRLKVGAEESARKKGKKRKESW